MQRQYYISMYLILVSFCINIFGYIHGVSLIWYLAVLVINFFVLLTNRVALRIPIHSELFLILVYSVYLILNTLINGFSPSNCQSIIQISVTIWLCYYAIFRDVRTFLRATVDVCSIILPINLLLCLLFRDGFVYASNGIGIYLMGNKNTMGMSIIALCLINILYVRLEGSKKTAVKRNFIIGAITILVTWCATAIVAMVVMIIFLFFSTNKLIQKIILYLSVKNITLIWVIGFLSINVFGIQNLFAFIVQNVLHKSITLSARTMIWNTAANAITRKWMFGYGFYDSGLLKNEYFTPANSHNFFLETLLTGGIVGSAFMVLLLQRFAKNLKKENDHIALILKLSYIVILIEGLVEATNMSLWFYLILILSEGFIAKRKTVQT